MSEQPEPQRQKRAIAAGIAAIALIAASHVSFAHSGTPEEQAACTPDVLTLCLFEIPNEDRIVACLNRHLDQLSPACRNVIAGPSEGAKKSGRRR
jgi:hypothetical protein